MATRLGDLRNSLHRLQNTRRLIRWGNGFSLLLNATAVILLIAFLADWQLDMTPAQRAVLLGIVCVALVWSVRRFTLPWLRQHDDIVALALAVEKQQNIDSDLVSALQFERPEASTWGSVQLEQAVISQVAESAPGINVFQGLPLADFKRRVLAAATFAVIVVFTAASQPGWYGAFFSRMLLSSEQYPTRTQLQIIAVNGQVLLNKESRDGHTVVKSIRSPFGHALQFHVIARGEIPESDPGQVRITSLDGDIATEIEITRPDPQADGGSELPDGIRQLLEHDPKENGYAVFTGELPRLMDSVTFRVFLGDARSRTFTIEAIPLPVVDLQVDVTPPAYAVGATLKSDARRSSKRQVSVVEGSRVDLTVQCLNKQLTSAMLWLGETEQPYQLTPNDGLKKLWTLNTTGTPLASVSEPLKYRVQVTDDQGLQLESPIHGTIRLRTDQAPRTAVSVRTRRVIPTAKPPIRWSASDDFGLDRVVAEVQIAREDGSIEEDEVEIAARVDGKAAPTSLDGDYPLDLSAFKLVKGDQLKVTFVAYDYRGEEGDSQRSFSEPVIFQVTDRQGILSGLLETDQESAKQLDAIIRRELGIGETR
jgi:hypothetical protein